MTEVALTMEAAAPPDYGSVNSLVSQLVRETRRGGDLTNEEQVNLEAFVRYRAAAPSDRSLFMAPGCKIHRRGITHLSALTGRPGQELNHSAMDGRTNEIEDLIVKGDRVWCVFTLRARHVGELYGVPRRTRCLRSRSSAFCGSRTARLPKAGSSPTNSIFAANWGSRSGQRRPSDAALLSESLTLEIASGTRLQACRKRTGKRSTTCLMAQFVLTSSER